MMYKISATKRFCRRTEHRRQICGAITQLGGRAAEISASGGDTAQKMERRDGRRMNGPTINLSATRADIRR